MLPASTLPETIMPSLHYREGTLFIEDVDLRLVATTMGTPCYVYSRASIENNWLRFDRAFAGIPHRVCYAVKANSNLAILNLLARLQSGFDIVSQGELERVIVAGGDPRRVVFSGVGKQTAEIVRAIECGVFCLDIESMAELERIHTLAAAAQQIVSIALRINPNIATETHAYIATGAEENKFGIMLAEVMPLCQQIKHMPYVRLIGIACHIGSQLLDITPFLQALDQLLAIYQQLLALEMPISYLNIGGGVGICYRDEKPFTLEAYAKALQAKLAGLPLELILEPGRAIVGNTGLLLTRVEYLKASGGRHFAIVDAGMNDLLRPALYQAWQTILPVTQRPTGDIKQYDIAGPVCESADFLGKDRPLAVEAHDLLAVCSAGAYGFSMSSNYNSRLRAAEVIVDRASMHLAREREAYTDLFAAERLLDD